jgi:putative ABC transport system permease protein
MHIWQDVRFAIRLLVKDRWFTLAAAFTLALGIGANAAVFTFVNAVLLRGLPFERSNEIITLAMLDNRGRENGISYPELSDWRESTTVPLITGFLNADVNVSDETHLPERFGGSYVSANLFRMIGQKPILGRDFAEDNDRAGAEPVLILGNAMWKTRYGADPNVLGKVIKANSKAYTVIGVMGPDLQFPGNGSLWMPLAQLPPDSIPPRREARGLNVIGRLKRGVSLEQAQAEFATIARRLADAYPATNKDMRPQLFRYNDRATRGPIRTIFLALMGAVAFVLLIACANVANLLLARSARRTREVAIRVSLGASRWRIVRQLLIESLLLSLLAGGVGLVLALFGIRWFDANTVDVGKPSWITFEMDGVVFAFIAAVCLGTAVMFGLAPALHVSKTDVNELLKDGGRSGSGGVRARRWTTSLMVAELALTLVLLTGAGLMMKSFMTLYTMDSGVDTSHLLTLQLYLPLTKYPQPSPRTVVYQQFEDRIHALPSIQAATLTTSVPMSGGMGRFLSLDERKPVPGDTPPTVTYLTVGDTYFDTFKLPVVRGRAFTSVDGTTGHEAAVVNQRFAAIHFKNEDPIGHRLRLATGDGPTAPATSATIVGIVPNVRQRGTRDVDPDPVVYVPYRADPQRNAILVVRTSADTPSVTASLREAMRTVEPDLPLFGVQTFDEYLSRQTWQYRVFGSMFALFALIALVLSAVGLYAVTSYSVTQRTAEIGIRMALGGQPKAMMWLVFKRALLQMAIGLPIGAAGALAVGRLVDAMLVRTSPTDPLTLVSVVVVLVLAAVAASLWPARRAAALNPVIALRYD